MEFYIKIKQERSVIRGYVIDETSVIDSASSPDYSARFLNNSFNFTF